MSNPLLENDGLVAVLQNAVFTVPFHGPRKHLAFGVFADRCQFECGFAMINSGYVLFDNWTFVKHNHGWTNVFF